MDEFQRSMLQQYDTITLVQCQYRELLNILTLLFFFAHAVILILEVVFVPTARTKANRKYNEKAYDRLAITIPKGRKKTIEAFAKQQGKSVNGLTNELLRAAVGLTEAQWNERASEVTEDE